MPLLALASTDDERLLSLVTVATLLPWLLLALPVGVLVDRVDRRLLAFTPAPADGVLRPGRRIAGLLAGVLRFADRQWGCDFGELSVAPDVHADAEAE